jgi:glycerophosphoryl diester phosphodiesterase
VANRLFDVQGHRGARGLAPENTLPAFSRALDLGVTTLELDCGITRDGVVVISHDRRLNPAITRDDTGRWLTHAGPAIRDLTWAELQRYDVGRIDAQSPYAGRFPHQQAIDGTRIPRLSDLFALVRERGDENVRFNIETKLSPLAPDETAAPELFVETLLETISNAGMQARVIVQSFFWRTLRLVQERMPDAPTSYLTAAQSDPHNAIAGPTAALWTDGFDVLDFDGSVPRMIEAAGGVLWSPDYGELSDEAIGDAHSCGLLVVPWTVNSESDMERLIACGVDGLISDYPNVLVRVAGQSLASPGT